MSSRPELKLDWATYKAAKYAVENWHYSQQLPAGKSVKIGAWENGVFVGVIMFGLGGGNSTHGAKYGLSKSHEVVELTRVALTTHSTPVSRMVAIAIKMMKKHSPGIRLVLSFADAMGRGHHGGIYQAGNWLYVGTFEGDGGFMIRGKAIHSRSVHSKGWKQQVKWLQEHVDPNAKKLPTLKHRYIMPLDDEIRSRVEHMAKPYPKREKQAMAVPSAQRRGSADLHAPKPKDSGEIFPTIKADAA
jgi:hypothetical protein